MYSFRRATLADLPAMFDIENAAGFNHWSAGQLKDSIEHHTVYCMEALSGLSGFAVFSTVLDEAELLNLVVAPGQQGRGMGKALLLHGLNSLHEQAFSQCTLEVGVSNTVAIHLYQQCGFEAVGLRKNYYQHANTTEDAMIMQLQLKEISCKN